MAKKQYHLIARRLCTECGRVRIFRLAMNALGQYAYICTKCGYWQDAYSFMEVK